MLCGCEKTRGQHVGKNLLSLVLIWQFVKWWSVRLYEQKQSNNTSADCSASLQHLRISQFWIVCRNQLRFAWNLGNTSIWDNRQSISLHVTLESSTWTWCCSQRDHILWKFARKIVCQRNIVSKLHLSNFHWHSFPQRSLPWKELAKSAVDLRLAMCRRKRERFQRHLKFHHWLKQTLTDSIFHVVIGKSDTEDGALTYWYAERPFKILQTVPRRKIRNQERTQARGTHRTIAVPILHVSQLYSRQVRDGHPAPKLSKAWRMYNSTPAALRQHLGLSQASWQVTFRSLEAYTGYFLSGHCLFWKMFEATGVWASVGTSPQWDQWTKWVSVWITWIWENALTPHCQGLFASGYRTANHSPSPGVGSISGVTQIFTHECDIDLVLSQKYKIRKFWNCLVHSPTPVFRWFEPYIVQCMVVKITCRHQEAKCVNVSLKDVND